MKKTLLMTFLLSAGFSMAEAQQLAEDGVKELILVAQETTLYGLDLYGRKSLFSLRSPHREQNLP